MFRIFSLPFIAVMILTAPVLAVSAHAQTHTESIAVVVNERAVTQSDVDNRMHLIMASSGMPDTAEVRRRIQPQVLNMLIDENLMMQEAERLGFTVSREEIEEGFETLARQNNMSAQEFRNVLRAQQIPMRALEDQISAQMAWSRIIQARIRPQIEITEGQLDAVLDRMAASEGAQEYRLYEIFLPVDTPQDEAAVRQLAERLTAELQQGNAPFGAVANQFSQSPTASRGGDMGWVQATHLSEALEEQVVRMNPGDLSRPIRSLSGFHILTVRDRRVISPETMPDRDELANILGMEEMNRLQRRYLQDLKAAAFIERRV